MQESAPAAAQGVLACRDWSLLGTGMVRAMGPAAGNTL